MIFIPKLINVLKTTRPKKEMIPDTAKWTVLKFNIYIYNIYDKDL
jgi:hypothetical protein